MRFAFCDATTWSGVALGRPVGRWLTVLKKPWISQGRFCSVPDLFAVSADRESEVSYCKNTAYPSGTEIVMARQSTAGRECRRPPSVVRCSEQIRRKAETQSYGAKASPIAKPAEPPATRSSFEHWWFFIGERSTDTRVDDEVLSSSPLDEAHFHLGDGTRNYADSVFRRIR